MDAAHAAVLGVVGEHGFAVVGGVAVAVGGAGRAVLEPACGLRIGGLGFWGLVRGAVGGGCNRHAGGTAAQTQTRKTGREREGRKHDAVVVHPSR